MNIPCGTICNVQGYFICHNGKAVCVITSQNALDYFWGYNPDNPEQEIERQVLARKLYDSAPKDSGDELTNLTNKWREYGELVDFAGAYKWEWNKDIFDFPVEKLKYLLKCVEKGEQPHVSNS